MILLQKLFGPTVRKNCSSDREKLLKFKAEDQEFGKFLRSLKVSFYQKCPADSPKKQTNEFAFFAKLRFAPRNAV